MQQEEDEVDELRDEDEAGEREPDVPSTDEIYAHLSLHVLHPTVRIAHALRGLVELSETLKDLTVTRGEESENPLVDVWTGLLTGRYLEHAVPSSEFITSLLEYNSGRHDGIHLEQLKQSRPHVGCGLVVNAHVVQVEELVALKLEHQATRQHAQHARAVTLQVHLDGVSCRAREVERLHCRRRVALTEDKDSPTGGYVVLAPELVPVGYDPRLDHSAARSLHHPTRVGRRQVHLGQLAPFQVQRGRRGLASRRGRGHRGRGQFPCLLGEIPAPVLVPVEVAREFMGVDWARQQRHGGTRLRLGRNRHGRVQHDANEDTCE